ncbi:PilZ domain-containing protein [Agarilytica rhodophyticola]|uniref:PilZ domain-containing protein n=1 Tax=Agarilytica rhodophyticola TaxID=1737490 RepID=UPI001FECF23B|nr:PilZ domain-containing protein [Agarilytica rhodophyticola]
MTYRKHGRTLVTYAVKLANDSLGEVVAETRDVSETGIFVKCKDLVKKISIGDGFKAEALLGSGKAMPKHLTVVRLTDEGIGLAFD